MTTHDLETIADYRRGVESGTMKHATPNVVRQLLDMIAVRLELEKALEYIAHFGDGELMAGYAGRFKNVAREALKLANKDTI